MASFNINFLPEHYKLHKEEDENRAETCPICRDVRCGAFPEVH